MTTTERELAPNGRATERVPAQPRIHQRAAEIQKYGVDAIAERIPSVGNQRTTDLVCERAPVQMPLTEAVK